MGGHWVELEAGRFASTVTFKFGVRVTCTTICGAEVDTTVTAPCGAGRLGWLGGAPSAHATRSSDETMTMKEENIFIEFDYRSR
jgi:hypothetical protein